MVVVMLVQGRRGSVQGSDPSSLRLKWLCDLRQVLSLSLSEPGFLPYKMVCGKHYSLPTKYAFFLSQINKTLVLS